MQTFSVVMQDADAADVIEAVTITCGYLPQVPSPDNPGEMIPNPVTPHQFVENVLGRHLLEIAAQYLVKKAEGEANRLASEAVGQRVAAAIEFFEANRVPAPDASPAPD